MTIQGILNATGFRILFALTLLIVSLGSIAAKPDVADFAKFDDYESITISPAGNYIAITHRLDDEDVLTIVRLSDMETMSSTRFGRNSGISNVLWANENRLLFEPAERIPGRTEYNVPTGEIVGIDIDGGNFELLFSFRAAASTGRTNTGRESMDAAATIIDVLPDDPEHVIIQTRGRTQLGSYNNAYEMDISNGRLREVAASPVRNGDFVTDSDHVVRLVSGINEEGGQELYYRADENSEFELVFAGEQLEGVLYPLASLADNTYLMADSVSEPILGLIRFDPETGEKKEVFRHPQVDVENYYYLPNRQVWAVRYADHFPGYFYPDETHSFARLHQQLAATFPQDDVQILNQTRDMKKAVVLVSGPTNPGEYFILDTEKTSLSHRLVRRPGLTREQLAEQSPIEMEVRDGTKVRGYLTLPRGKEKDLPMVVLVHGGPHGIYDSWGFDPEVQLLAANGYAVLQVNFRGSGGRGLEFQAMGYGKWGKEMQEDLTDAALWAIQQGYADKDRICIYGGSYGGYAALTGVFKTPDLYQCAIGYVGVYDLPLMFERGDTQRVQSGINFQRRALGTDMDELRSRSPVYNADKIKAGIMLAHGKIDERVPWEHAKRMRAALKDAGQDPEWILESGEGHGFLNVDNRIDYYKAMLRFLKRHLKP